MARFAFFDIDKTIYDGFSTCDFYFFIADQGIKTDYIHARSGELEAAYFSGALSYQDFSYQIVKLAAEAVQGLSLDEVRLHQNEFISLYDNRFYPWVRTAFELLRKNDFQIYLISAATSVAVDPLAALLKADSCFSSQAEMSNGAFTGELTLMLNFEEKKKQVQTLMKNSGESGLTLAFGDSTGDVEMLSSVDQAFVVHPREEEMIYLARKNNWVVADHTTLLPELEKALSLLEVR